MRNLATTILALLCLLSLSAIAFAEPNGTAAGTEGPTIQDPSNQTVIFHYVPSGPDGARCLDAFARGCKLRHAPGSPPFASGSIGVPSQVATGAVFAQLYWVILADTPPPATETLNGFPLTRIAIGPVTPSPCWAELSAFAYRADVTGLLVPGNNLLGGFPDSGVNNTAPETEGASLVIVYHASGVDKEIIITAGNDLVALGSGVTTASLPLPVATADGVGAELVMIGADGQVAADEAYWNGVALDSGDAWLGIDPGPGVGYWDTLEFGVFTAAPNTVSTSTLPPTLDCINWVGTVLKVKNGGCETVPVEPKTWGGMKELYRGN
jgi:hypothetical protein